MRVARLVCAALAAFFLPVAAQAADGGNVWKAQGPWAADYGNDYCQLLRGFTKDDKTIVLALERTQPGAFVRMIVIGDAVKTFRNATSIGYSLRPGGGDRKGFMYRAKAPDGQQLLDLGQTTLEPIPVPTPGSTPEFKPYKPEEERAAAAAIKSVELNSGVVDSIDLETGSLEAAVGALQTCTYDLIKQWGVDAEAHKTLKQYAMPDGLAYEWLPQNTVPFTEFSKLVRGFNAVRVMVSADGKPTSCTVQRPTLAAEYNKAVCDALMKNAKFTPAQDANGNAIASYWMTEVFGLMPPFGGGPGR